MWRQVLSRWAPPARPGETPLVLASILVTGALLAESFGTSYFSLLFAVLVAVAAGLTLLAVRLTRRLGFPLLRMVLFMALAGNVGLLLGARLDFGPAGLVALTGAFSKLPPLSLQTVWTKLTLEPLIAIRPDIHTCPFGCATETEGGKPLGSVLISRQTAIPTAGCCSGAIWACGSRGA
jgi:hypothetical protein